MRIGKYYESNQQKLNGLNDRDWLVVLKKCKEHIKLRLKQRTLFGVHSESRLGGDPVDHYLGIACEKLIAGDWEWKDEYPIIDQMVRIINSHISTVVETERAQKGTRLEIDYIEDESQFYYNSNAPPEEQVDESEYEEKLRTIEAAISEDAQLMFLLEALREGKKRDEIASLLEIQPRQLDKLRERLIRTVKNYKPS